MRASDFFEFPESLPFGGYFDPAAAPWEWLAKITEALEEAGAGDYPGDIPSGFNIEGPVFIHPSVCLPPFGSITGPAYIGEDCVLRPGVYVRGKVIAGRSCVLGNSCEFKNALLLDGVQVPHFSYVGDSILGNKAHLGAGVICSNLRLDQKEVKVRDAAGRLIPTGLRKLGAILGDAAEVGCNAVLNPGAVLGRRSLVMPGVAFGGTLAENSIALVKSTTTVVRRID